MSRPRPALLLALLAAIGGLVALLTSAPPGVTLRADVRPTAPVELPRGEHCTGLRVLPDETRAVRAHLAPGERAPQRLELRAEGIDPIRTEPGVRRGDRIEYRLPREHRGERGGAAVCSDEQRRGAALLGEGETPSLTLLGAPRSNWLAALPLLADRAGFGRGGLLGDGALWIALALLAAAWVLTLRVGGAALRGGGPVTRRLTVQVAAVAALFGAAFAITTPPLQAPDEMQHFHYAELLADKGHVPQSNERGPMFSPQLQQVLGGAAVGTVAFSGDRRPPWSDLEDERLDATLDATPPGGAIDAFDNHSSQPPGYYSLLALAQQVAGGSVLDRLLLDRLLSALLFAVGVAGAMVFAREAVPRAGGLAVAGGLMLAWLPITGFIGGSVNPDAALMATSAWTLAITAMILRRGVTLRRALALGVAVGLGLLSKLTFIGLLPAVAVAGVIVVARALRSPRGRPALLAVGAALGAAALVALPYFAWAQLSGRGIVFGPPGPPGPPVTLRETLAYTVELYAGRFGPLADRIPNSGPIDIWGAGLAGRLGWLDYGFPRNVVLGLMAAWGLLAAGAVWGLVRAWRARRAFPTELLVYAAAVAGVALLIARSGLVGRLGGMTGFEQARYLFPVAAIGVGGVALALRHLPRAGWREWAGALVIVGAATQGTVAFAMTVGRYFA